MEAVKMKIEKFELCNFRGIERLEFDFSKQLNLFVGINGSGKSTILDGLATSLSWLVNRIERPDAKGSHIKNSDIRNDQDGSFLDIHVKVVRHSYRWILAKTSGGLFSDFKSQLGGVSELAERFRQDYEDESLLPMIAYYPINRAVKERIPFSLRGGNARELDVYQSALSGRTNYQDFFEWFRVQDDILNEQAQSRTKWMIQNRSLIKRRYNKLLTILTQYFQKWPDTYNIEGVEFLLKRFEKDRMVFEEPRFLLHELANLTQTLGVRSHEHIDIEETLHDLEYMYHKMESLSGEFKDNLMESGGMHRKVIKRAIRNFDRMSHAEEMDPLLFDLLWESFGFATWLSLWWMTNESKRKLGKVFRNVSMSGGRQRKSLFSEFKTIPGTIDHIIREDMRKRKNAYRNEGRELQIVRKAVEKFMPGYKNLEIKRVPRPRMMLKKDGEFFNLDQLSDGEKGFITLVGDIARRLTIANPNLENPLRGKGIVLIDEIDLHLHPNWQRQIVPKLLKIFPNCQFFISTHSPQVISHVKPENIFLLNQTKEGISFNKPSETYGMSIDRTVELVMDDEARPEEIRDELDSLFECIEREQFKKAKEIVANLKKDMPTDPEILQAEMLIRRGESKK
jgi:predicted ATP-binding protein involved in virulence